MARAAPEIATAMSRPLPVWPISQPSGHGDQCRDRDREERVREVLQQGDRDRLQAPAGVAGEDPCDRFADEVHATLTSSGSGAAAGAATLRTRPRHQHAARGDEQSVDDERDDDHGDDSREHLGDDPPLRSVREQVAEVGDADQRAHRGERDRADRGDAQAGEDHRAGEREVDRPESAGRRHSPSRSPTAARTASTEPRPSATDRTIMAIA